MFHHDCDCRRAGHVRRVLGMILVGVAIAALLALAVMLLWNGLMPGIFGLRTIRFCQALGLLLLVRILFGGIHPRRHHCHPHHPHRPWEELTPEERARFRRGFRGLFCCGERKPPE